MSTYHGAQGQSYHSGYGQSPSGYYGTGTGGAQGGYYPQWGGYDQYGAYNSSGYAGGYNAAYNAGYNYNYSPYGYPPPGHVMPPPPVGAAPVSTDMSAAEVSQQARVATVTGEWFQCLTTDPFMSVPAEPGGLRGHGGEC